MKRGGSSKYWYVYRVGQIEIGHSSETSLIQENKGENLPKEWDFRPLCGAVNYCVFRASRGFVPWTPTRTLPWTHWGLQRPQIPAELSNRDLIQMRTRGQRTAFEIHHCTKWKDL